MSISWLVGGVSPEPAHSKRPWFVVGVLRRPQTSKVYSPSNNYDARKVSSKRSRCEVIAVSRNVDNLGGLLELPQRERAAVVCKGRGRVCGVVV